MKSRARPFTLFSHFAAVAAVAAVALASGSGCVSAYKASVGGETEQVFSRVFITDFNTAWQAALDALKYNRLDISNREGGFIQTRWTDNTADKNFTESFNGADSFLKAQYRFRVTLSKGPFTDKGKQTVKVSVLRDQLVQRDVLEGFKPVETDSIEENTLLYRIGRIVFMRMKIARLEAEKTKKEIDQAEQKF